MNEDRELDPRLKEYLDALIPVPPRDPHRASRERARFLAEAAELEQAVSAGRFPRLTKWKAIFTVRKEKLAMNLLVSIAVIVGLLFSGGVTVQAAQDDLPTDLLYPVKTLSEDVRLWLNTDPQKEIGLLGEFAQRRGEEISALAEEGVAPPPEVIERMDQHIEQMLQIAASMDDAAMEHALERVRATLEAQLQMMAAMQERVANQGRAAQALMQTRAMIEERLNLVAEGMSDPARFRETMRYGPHGIDMGVGTPPGPPETEPPGPPTMMPPHPTMPPGPHGTPPHPSGPDQNGTHQPPMTPGTGNGAGGNMGNGMGNGPGGGMGENPPRPGGGGGSGSGSGGGNHP